MTGAEEAGGPLPEANMNRMAMELENWRWRYFGNLLDTLSENYKGSPPNREEALKEFANQLANWYELYDRLSHVLGVNLCEGSGGHTE